LDGKNQRQLCIGIISSIIAQLRFFIYISWPDAVSLQYNYINFLIDQNVSCIKVISCFTKVSIIVFPTKDHLLLHHSASKFLLAVSEVAKTIRYNSSVTNLINFFIDQSSELEYRLQHVLLLYKILRHQSTVYCSDITKPVTKLAGFSVLFEINSILPQFCSLECRTHLKLTCIYYGINWKLTRHIHVSWCWTVCNLLEQSILHPSY
jgi:hypothetical protein